MVYTIEGSVTFGLVALGCNRKHIEQGVKSKPLSNISLWTLFQFLPWAPDLISFDDGP